MRPERLDELYAFFKLPPELELPVRAAGDEEASCRCNLHCVYGTCAVSPQAFGMPSMMAGRHGKLHATGSKKVS
jgi:hypothetical protein